MDYGYVDEAGDPVYRHQIEEMFRDMLDEIYDTVTMGEFAWDPSRILEEMDPIAFRCGVNDYESSLLEDGQIFEREDEA